MDTSRQSGNSDHPIRSVLSRMSEYARAKDIDGLLSLYHPAATSFEFGAHESPIGLEQIRQSCINGYAEIGSSFEYEFTPFDIIGGDDVAICYGIERIRGTQNGEKFEIVVRATYCFNRVEDRWLIAHQHLSSPSTSV